MKMLKITKILFLLQIVGNNVFDSSIQLFTSAKKKEQEKKKEPTRKCNPPFRWEDCHIVNPWKPDERDIAREKLVFHKSDKRRRKLYGLPEEGECVAFHEYFSFKYKCPDG